ncbi:hypothetical protein QBC37DRAFT_407223 [Rhypophila decipiens]|uniref:Uncharacterized protein n=1 Tax=Rhypophila decipiens TaxID=261697 RepID=A0AAN6XTI5_9PEZI|nr:hypothetical protein QBC37DRAFT_407223 [Rhypophila decipiens]
MQSSTTTRTSTIARATARIDHLYQGLISAAEMMQDEEEGHRQLKQEQVVDQVNQHQAKADKGKAKAKASLYPEEKQEQVKIQLEDIGNCIQEIWNNTVCMSEVERAGGYSKTDVVRLIVGIWEVADVVSRQDGKRFTPGFGSSARDWCESKTGLRYDQVVGRPSCDHVNRSGARYYWGYGSDEMKE